MSGYDPHSSFSDRHPVLTVVLLVLFAAYALGPAVIWYFKGTP